MAEGQDSHENIGSKFGAKAVNPVAALHDVNLAQNHANSSIYFARALLENSNASTIFANQAKYIGLHNVLFNALRELDSQNTVHDIDKRELIGDDNMCAKIINNAISIIDERPDIALSKDLYDEIQHLYSDLVAKGHKASIDAMKLLQGNVDDILDHEVIGMIGILEDSIAPAFFEEDENFTSFAGKLLVLADRPQDQGKRHMYQARAIKATRGIIKIKTMPASKPSSKEDEKKLHDLIITIGIIQEQIPNNIQTEIGLDNE